MATADAIQVTFRGIQPPKSKRAYLRREAQRMMAQLDDVLFGHVVFERHRDRHSGGLARGSVSMLVHLPATDLKASGHTVPEAFHTLQRLVRAARARLKPRQPVFFSSATRRPQDDA